MGGAMNKKVTIYQDVNPNSPTYGKYTTARIDSECADSCETDNLALSSQSDNNEISNE